MIKSKEDFYYYLEEDKKNYPNRNWIEKLLYPSEHDVIWHQIYNLRLLEYRQNTKHSLFSKLLYVFQRMKYVRILNRTQMRLHPNVFGPGLYIPHIGRISVSSQAMVGANCTIRPNTLIASNMGVGKTELLKVVIGDNVEISEGCKIFCKRIGNNVKIGPNSVVFRNIPDNTSVFVANCKYVQQDI